MASIIHLDEMLEYYEYIAVFSVCLIISFYGFSLCRSKLVKPEIHRNHSDVRLTRSTVSTLDLWDFECSKQEE